MVSGPASGVPPVVGLVLPGALLVACLARVPARRCASPVTLGVGSCRALASSVWSLRCAFAIASCSVRSGLRFLARCVSSVGSVRSGVSLPLSGGGIAVRSERLLSRPLLPSLCAGWSCVAVAFVSWTGDRCWGSLGLQFGFLGPLYQFCWRRMAWSTGLGAPAFAPIYLAVTFAHQSHTRTGTNQGTLSGDVDVTTATCSTNIKSLANLSRSRNSSLGLSKVAIGRPFSHSLHQYISVAPRKELNYEYHSRKPNRPEHTHSG